MAASPAPSGRRPLCLRDQALTALRPGGILGCRHVAVCTHLDQVQILEPPEHIAGCAECMKTGSSWVHLRMCQTCGEVGCCAASPNRHASRPARDKDHPVLCSVEPGEDWSWCLIDEVGFVLSGE